MIYLSTLKENDLIMNQFGELGIIGSTIRLIQGDNEILIRKIEFDKGKGWIPVTKTNIPKLELLREYYKTCRKVGSLN